MGDVFVLPDGMFISVLLDKYRSTVHTTMFFRPVGALSAVSVVAKSLRGCDVLVCYFPLINNENSQLTETLQQ